MSYSLRMGNPSMIRQETLDNLLRLRNLKKVNISNINKKVNISNINLYNLWMQ